MDGDQRDSVTVVLSEGQTDKVRPPHQQHHNN